MSTASNDFAAHLRTGIQASMAIAIAIGNDHGHALFGHLSPPRTAV